jgi:hypothetical protein
MTGHREQLTYLYPTLDTATLKELVSIKDYIIRDKFDNYYIIKQSLEMSTGHS